MPLLGVLDNRTADACKARLDSAPMVNVGEGQLAWHAVTDNQVLQWEKGPQGGHHIWIALRLTGLAQSLYARKGFEPKGKRRGYYQTPAGARLDALVLARAI